MEYSSTKSNRSLRSVQLDEIEPSEAKGNSIIIEEKEHDDTTKYSEKRKKSIVLPEIKNKATNQEPAYYYSLQFERNKLGTISTRVIKEQVNKIRKKCISIASALSERGATENSSTTDTIKNGQYLKKVSNHKNINRNHRIVANKRYIKPLVKVRSIANLSKKKLKSRQISYLK